MESLKKRPYDYLTVLDLVISVLMEHERKLDDAINAIEEIVKRMENL